MQILISITGLVEELNFPLQVLHWLCLDLCEAIDGWRDNESLGISIEYPLAVKVADVDSWLECRVDTTNSPRVEKE